MKKGSISLPPPGSERRDNAVRVMLNDDEYQRLVDLADKRGEPVARVMRYLAFAALDALEY